ncbi:hypothetical protein SCUCBS95973_006534 [Sporothrix curviconia]|uniref:Aminoglycoside phosphotransferase domain-containing protein n=1 Tax=Sporothrix curviconia TaxID=1260050 RepID=A0ABP0C5Y0_9PEZI
MADSSAHAVERALAAIDGAKLPFPDNELLESFLQEAADPVAAARYLLQRGTSSSKAGLDMRPLLADWKALVALFMSEAAPRPAVDKRLVAAVWKRDSGKCCLTDFKSSLLDPLLVAPIHTLQKPVPESLHVMFGAFIGAEMQQRIISHDASLDSPGNFWLVRKSAAAAMAQGWIQIGSPLANMLFLTVLGFSCPVRPSILDRMPVMRRTTFANSAAPDVDAPDVALMRLSSQFTKPIRWSLFAREIAARQSPPQPLMPPRVLARQPPSLWRRAGSVAAALCLDSWRRFVPGKLRIRLYCFLGMLGTRWYGPTSSMSVQQLPFGLYLKTTYVAQHLSLINEQAALQLVHQHTNIPVPRPLDLVSDAHMSYLLMTRAPGIRLGACIDVLGDDEAELLSRDLQQCLDEIRSIPRQTQQENAGEGAAAAQSISICGVLGGPLYDHRVYMGMGTTEEAQSLFKGPFENEDEFNKALQTNALPGLAHRSGHRIVFTHGDLNMRNILMRNGRLSAIVDWENASWCPEYWDYTKAHFVTKLKKRWLRIVDDAFRPMGNFQSELAVQKQYWWYCC